MHRKKHHNCTCTLHTSQQASQQVGSEGWQQPDSSAWQRKHRPQEGAPGGPGRACQRRAQQHRTGQTSTGCLGAHAGRAERKERTRQCLTSVRARIRITHSCSAPTNQRDLFHASNITSRHEKSVGQRGSLAIALPSCVDVVALDRGRSACRVGQSHGKGYTNLYIYI